MGRVDPQCHMEVIKRKRLLLAALKLGAQPRYKFSKELPSFQLNNGIFFWLPIG